MNVYCFYIRINKIHDDRIQTLYAYDDMDSEHIIDGEPCYLYAYTKKKKYYKEFVKTRNMDKFYPIMFNMTEDEYNEFHDKYHNTFELYPYDYPVYPVNTEYGDVETLTVLSTELETNDYELSYEFLEEGFLWLEEAKDTMFYLIAALSDKWRKRIGYEVYLGIIDMITGWSNNDPVLIDVDGFEYLMRHYGELFK